LSTKLVGSRLVSNLPGFILLDTIANYDTQTCVNTLAIRNMIRPFENGMLNQACPMSDILGELSSQLEELKMYKEQADFTMAPS